MKLGVHLPDPHIIKNSLGPALADEWFQSRIRSAACLGTSAMTSKPVYLDIASAPHVLIAGTTGSGKTVLVHNIILSIIAKNGSANGRLLLIDPKGTEFSVYKNSGLLWKPVIKETDTALSALRDAVKLMEERFANVEKRDLDQWDGWKLYIVVDELADFFMSSQSGREASALLLRLAQKGRAAGIHLILATQQPSVKVMPSALKANCPTRIALRTANMSDSRIILDRNGAESLAGRGDAIIQYADGGSCRFQAYYSERQERRAFCEDHYVKKFSLFGKYIFRLAF